MLDNAAARAEFEQITQKNVMPVAWEVQASLIVDGVEQLRFRDVVADNITSDYETSIGDYRFITVQLGPVTYRDVIIPNYDKLKIRVERRIKNIQHGDSVTGTTTNEVFLALLTDPIDLDQLATGRAEDDENLLENSALATVTFQLVEEELYYNLSKDVCGIYQGKTEDVLGGLLNISLQDNASTASLKDRNYSGARGLRSEPFQNRRDYDNIVVKQGVRLGKLASYLQERYGISSFGLGCYFSGGFWYLYPLYKNNRLDSYPRTLTVFNVPVAELPTVENSFSLRANQLFVISTGNTVIKDDRGRTEANQGNGLRITPASFLENNLFIEDGNKLTPRASQSARSIGTKESGHGINNVKYTKKLYTSNPYPELSELYRGRGKMITVPWHNSDPSLLVPGMPVRFYYRHKGNLVPKLGTLLGHTSTLSTNSGLSTDVVYTYMTKLVLFIED